MPTQVPIQGQWWSNFNTQLSQLPQCVVLKGLIILQELQILYFWKYPNWLIIIVFLSLWLLKEFSFKAIADSSFLCIIPGSESPLNDKNIVVNIKRNRTSIIKKLVRFVIMNYTIYENN